MEGYVGGKNLGGKGRSEEGGEAGLEGLEG